MATTSMNGYTLIDTGDLQSITAGGLTTKVRVGAAATVLQYVGQRFHDEVEELATFYGWRSVALNAQIGGHPRSNHPSGTAIDCNGARHARYAKGTFTTAQVAAIRRILADCDGCVRWGGDFGAALIDEMHFEIVGTPAQVTTLATRLTAQLISSGGTTTPAVTVPPTPTTPAPISPTTFPEGLLTMKDIVRYAFLRFLGREPTESDYQFRIARVLEGHVTAMGMVREIATSDEAWSEAARARRIKIRADWRDFTVPTA